MDKQLRTRPHKTLPSSDMFLKTLSRLKYYGTMKVVDPDFVLNLAYDVKRCNFFNIELEREEFQQVDIDVIVHSKFPDEVADSLFRFWLICGQLELITTTEIWAFTIRDVPIKQDPRTMDLPLFYYDTPEDGTEEPEELPVVTATPADVAAVLAKVHVDNVVDINIKRQRSA